MEVVEASQEEVEAPMEVVEVSMALVEASMDAVDFQLPGIPEVETSVESPTGSCTDACEITYLLPLASTNFHRLLLIILSLITSTLWCCLE